jgi:glycoprotein-N-acetylgalactosamine 3-beta-galactosyltransferase
MLMIRSPFVFLGLAGLSWFTLLSIRLPPDDILASVPPPGIFSQSKEATLRNKKYSDKPLRPTNLPIVRNATPMDLVYVDVSGNHEKDPHRGARDEKGNWGYVHDETALRLHPPAFPTDRLEQDCQERDADQAMLTEKVLVDMKAHEAKRGTKRANILCMIYATDASHEKMIPAIRETWGQKCDGFMVGSNKTDVSLDAVDIPHSGPEIYRNMWQKVRSMWSYVYDNYYDKYDWFHIGGDDMYVLVENLRLYVESDEIQMAANGGTYLPSGEETLQTPLFLGRRLAFDGKMSRIYNTGGPGYTLNKAALKLLVTSGWGSDPDRQTYAEDVFVSRALLDKGVMAYDTKDETGAERYMHYPVSKDSVGSYHIFPWHVSD